MALSRGDDHWHSYALSYGVREVDEAEADWLANAVLAYFALQELEDRAERHAAEVEWLVRLAEHPTTRWEGAFELEPNRYARAPLDAGGVRRFDQELTPEQWERLTLALLDGDALNDPLWPVVRDRGDPRALRWFLLRLDMTAEDPPYGLDEQVEWLTGHLGDADLRAWTEDRWMLEIKVSKDTGERRVSGWLYGDAAKQEATIREFITRTRRVLDAREAAQPR